MVTESGPQSDPLRVLVVDDEESMRHFLSRALRRRGFLVEVVTDGEAALAALGGEAFDVMLTDVRMPGMDGRELFRKALDVSPGTRTVIMTAYGSVKDAITAMEQGAESYLAKPFETEELVATISKAGEKARLLAENRVLREQLTRAGTFAGLIGKSAVMRRLYRTIERVARAGGTVLVTGESGAGKGMVARAVHERSERAAGPFLSAHCGALPATLIEAELYGVVEGAFTGADRTRAGYVQRAAGGTLLLDEIAEVPLDVQSSLLRFLETGEVVRVGGEEVARPDVRVIAASNRDLRSLVEEGTFRDDLFYPLIVPPLRDRVDDIPLLVTLFLTSVGRPELVFSPEVMAHLQGLPWPGNVRALQNLVERLAGTVEAEVVTLEELPTEESVKDVPVPDFRPYRQAMEGFERDYLQGLLRQARGNVSEAARLGGMARPSLHARIAALGLDVSEFREQR